MLPLLAVVASVLVAYAASRQPRSVFYSRPLPPAKASTTKICAALHALRSISPDNPPTAFELMRLDPYAAPFHPPRDSAYPGSRRHSEVEATVIKAMEDLRSDLWPQTGRLEPGSATERVVYASYLVGTMLIDDDARNAYLELVQPNLRGWVGTVKAIDGLCGGMWRALEWED
ncbi:hypothetical protein LY76DRAFT_583440 [Colletotrichum caudatum]|nr:hypothetical protein LY76DRAFT_583440 [Colletotrichum caudatum]